MSSVPTVPFFPKAPQPCHSWTCRGHSSRTPEAIGLAPRKGSQRGLRLEMSPIRGTRGSPGAVPGTPRAETGWGP